MQRGEAGEKGDAACVAEGEAWFYARPLSCSDSRPGVSGRGWGVAQSGSASPLREPAERVTALKTSGIT